MPPVSGNKSPQQRNTPRTYDSYAFVLCWFLHTCFAKLAAAATASAIYHISAMPRAHRSAGNASGWQPNKKNKIVTIRCTIFLSFEILCIFLVFCRRRRSVGRFAVLTSIPYRKVSCLSVALLFEYLAHTTDAASLTKHFYALAIYELRHVSAVLCRIIHLIARGTFTLFGLTDERRAFPVGCQNTIFLCTNTRRDSRQHRSDNNGCSVCRHRMWVMFPIANRHIRKIGVHFGSLSREYF